MKQVKPMGEYATQEMAEVELKRTALISSFKILTAQRSDC